MEPVIHVAIGVVVDRQGQKQRLLITRRPKQSVLGGYWEFPGGKVEQHETMPQCLTREFEEELGIDITVGQPLPTIQHTYPHGTIKLNPFLCTHRSGQIQHRAVSQHKWVTPSELQDYPFPPANQALIDHLIDTLSKPPAKKTSPHVRHRV